MITQGTSEPLDKGQHYGEFTESERWQDELYDKACHKALDIRKDGLGIHNHGIGAKGVVGVVAAAMLGPVAMAGLWAMSSMGKQPENPPPVQTAPADREYEIIHRDADGNVVDVKPWTGNKQ